MQMLRPGFVLGQISEEQGALSRHLFATVGMFMVASGATLHRSLAPAQPDAHLIRLAAAQKLGASLAVGLGVGHGLFRRKALAVAAFDLASAVGCFAYARSLDTAEPAK
jgi:hypothetical protein